MNESYNPKLRQNSRNLRKNMTRQEKHLWYDFLKNLPITVNRQKIFENYIVDFYCAEYKLVIELDGSQHFEDENIQRDMKRDEYFKSNGIKVLRYSNLDIDKNFVGVCSDILLNMKKM